MNWDQLRGTWSQLKGKAKEKWGRLTDNDLEVIRGKREQLLGKLRELYGIAKAEAQRQVTQFERSAGSAFKRGSRKARKSGRGTISAAKKAGRAAAGAALDAASSGLDKLRGLIAPHPQKKRKAAPAASKGRTAPRKATVSKSKRAKKRH
jgi:uncharacterized protein YjbJ (UPF0337 family)